MLDADEIERDAVNEFKLELLGWTPKQLLDESLVAPTITPPLRYRGCAREAARALDEALYPLVLEECRAGLAQALERASGAEPMWVDVLQARSPKGMPWRLADVRFEKRPEDAMALFSGSVWLLSERPWTGHESMGRCGRCELAVVRGRPPSEIDDETLDPLEQTLQTRLGVDELLDKNEWSALHLGTIITEQRIAGKLAVLAAWPTWPLLPFFLDPGGPTIASGIGVGGGSLLSGPVQNDMRTALQQLEKVGKLNPSQREAVERALFGEGSPALLIHGPPGTGKTLTLAAYLLLAVGASVRMAKTGTATARALRVLVCAPTNVAASNVATKLLALAKSEPKFPVHDLALLASEERIEVTPELSRVFVKHRVKRLRDAVGSWSSSFVNAAEQLKPTADVQLDIHGVEQLVQRLQATAEEVVAALERDAPAALPGRSKRDALVSSARKAIKELLEALCTFKNTKSTEARENLLHLVQRAGALMGSVARVARSTWEEAVVGSARVVFCTLSGAHSSVLRDDTGFPVVVVDEAAQAPEALTTLVYRSGVQCLVLAGDPQQLQATVLSQACKRLEYGRSLFERLYQLREEAPSISYVLLNVQYRMHPDISRFPNNQFYNGRVQDGPTVGCERPWHNDELFPPIRFIDVRDEGERVTCEDGAGMSYSNLAEAELVKFLCDTFVRRYKESGVSARSRIGVISPYSGQIALIEAMLSGDKAVARQRNRAQRCVATQGDAPVEVRTVDGFQGGEKDVIIFSAVRSKALGFLCDHRRLNVAITRAISSLIVIGNAATLRRDDNWGALLAQLKKADGVRAAGPAPVPRCVWSAEKHPQLQRLLSEDAQAKLRRVEALRKATSELRAGDDPRRPGPDSIWSVVLSENALKALKDLARDEIVECILRIAAGRRSGAASSRQRKQERALVEVCADEAVSSKALAAKAAAQQAAAAGESVSYQVEEESIMEFRILWGFCMATQGKGIVMAIRVHEILTVKSKDDDVTHVAATRESIRRTVAAQYSDPYLRLCAECELERGPKSLGKEASFQWNRSEAERNRLQGNGPIYNNLLKTYQLTYESMRSIVTGRAKQLELLLALKPEEQRIAHSEQTLFLLGRGGSGKSTILMWRMGEKEEVRRAAILNGLELPTERFRQLLVTANARLCRDLQSQFTRVCNALPALPDEDEDRGNVNAEADGSPKALSQLSCPFAFVTYERFLKLLDADLRRPYFSAVERQESATGVVDVKERLRSSSAVRRCVDGRIFQNEYWPAMNEKLRRRKEAGVVLSEIMSLIKGSKDAVVSGGPVLRAAFVNTDGEYAWRSAFPTAKMREEVYDLFELYERLKKQRGEYDLADAALHVLAELKAGRYERSALSYVYVDEVQDLSIAQLAVFAYVCVNVDGFSLAGDTAQTIAQGSGFRFEDVKANFYEHVLPIVAAAAGVPVPPVPPLRLLTTNYRTHRGVLNLSTSLTLAIKILFPLSIDDVPTGIAAERSTKDASTPLLVRGLSVDDFAGLLAEGSWTADQVVLVRGEESKARLEDAYQSALERQPRKDGEWRQRAIVLTALESKGLEFQDALVFDFVSGCSTDIVSAFKKLDVLLAAAGSEERQARLRAFDAQRHEYAALCFELKLLYVAITRAKGQVVVLESSNEAAEPLIRLWKSPLHCKESCGAAELVKECSPAEARSALDLATKVWGRGVSWVERGEQMLEQGQFEDALRCFRNANDKRGITLAEAYIEHERAEQLAADADSNAERQTEALQAFLSAANAVASPPLDNLGLAIRWCFDAINCLRRWGDSHLYQTVYRDAAGYLKRSCRLLDAADTLAAGDMHEEAVAVYRKEGSRGAINKALGICRDQFDSAGKKQRGLVELAAEILVQEGRKATNDPTEAEERANWIVEFAQVVFDRDREDPSHVVARRARLAFELLEARMESAERARRALQRAGLRTAGVGEWNEAESAITEFLRHANDVPSVLPTSCNELRTALSACMNVVTSTSDHDKLQLPVDRDRRTLEGHFSQIASRFPEHREVEKLAKVADAAAAKSNDAGSAAKSLVLRFVRILPHNAQAHQLETFGYFDELVALEAGRGNFARVAEVHLLLRHDHPKAFDAYIKAKMPDKAVETQLDYARAGFDLRGAWAAGVDARTQQAVREALRRAADLLASAGDAEFGPAAGRLRLLSTVLQHMASAAQTASDWATLLEQAVKLDQPDIGLLCQIRQSSPMYSDRDVTRAGLIAIGDAIGTAAGTSARTAEAYYKVGEAAVKSLAHLRDGVAAYGERGDLGQAAFTAKWLMLARDHPRKRRVLLVHAFAPASPVLSPSEVSVGTWAASALERLRKATDDIMAPLLQRMLDARLLLRAAAAALLPRTPGYAARALQICLGGSLEECRFGEQIIDKDEAEKSGLVQPKERHAYFADCAKRLSDQHRTARDRSKQMQLLDEAHRFVRRATPDPEENADEKRRQSCWDARALLLEQCELLDVLIAFERGRGNTRRVAEVHKWRGEFLMAAKVYRDEANDAKGEAEALASHVRSYFSALGRPSRALEEDEGLQAELLHVVVDLLARLSPGARDRRGQQIQHLRLQLEVLDAALDPSTSRRFTEVEWGRLADQADVDATGRDVDLAAFCRRRAFLALDLTRAAPGAVLHLAAHLGRSLAALLAQLQGATPGPAGRRALAAFCTRRCGNDEMYALDAGRLASAAERAAGARRELEAEMGEVVGRFRRAGDAEGAIAFLEGMNTPAAVAESVAIGVEAGLLLRAARILSAAARAGALGEADVQRLRGVVLQAGREPESGLHELELDALREALPPPPRAPPRGPAHAYARSS